jgi:hypothetical protein
MRVPDGPLITARHFDQLVNTIPGLTATQPWDIADTFGHRVVALPEGSNTNTGSDTERSRTRPPRGETRLGFTAE